MSSDCFFTFLCTVMCSGCDCAQVSLCPGDDACVMCACVKVPQVNTRVHNT